MTGSGDTKGLLESVGRVAPLPRHVVELIERAAVGGVLPADLRRLFGNDPRILERIVRHAKAQSPWRNGGSVALEAIVEAVGSELLARLAVVACVETHLVDGLPYAGIARTIWAHALTVGHVAGELAPRALGRPSVAATAGILHEAGRLVALRIAPDLIAAGDRAVESGLPLSEADRRSLGVPAAKLSVCAARALGLPSVVCAVLEELQTPSIAPSPEVVALSAADRLAPLLGYPVYRNALGAPLDPEVERALDLHPAAIQRLASGAARAARLADSREAQGQQEGGERAGFDALLAANRRLAKLNSDYEKTRLELEHRIEETRSLVATFASLTMGLDAEALRYSILESLLEHYQADATFLVTGEGGSGRLDGVAFSMREGVGPDVIPFRLDLSRFDRETRETLLQGAAVTLRGGATSQLLRRELGDCRLYCMAPIMTRGVWSGILGLAVGEDGEETTAKGEFLNILATAAALGLENARLYAEVLQQATVDPLTGVATRRVVVEELEQIASKPPSAREPFAVLLVDLDNFKAVNDTFGHQVGDEYLKQMASAMQASLRRQDSLGRYGGDEFLVLLRDVDLEEAQRIAELIRQRTESVALDPRWQEVLEPLGASIGVSWWDGEPVDAVCLLAMADSSLYLGKAQGRNAVGHAAVREPAAG